MLGLIARLSESNRQGKGGPGRPSRKRAGVFDKARNLRNL
ncbi:hypothetical protein N181_00490 [Sinorhizobium fredii USDA 205]|nr:hypothetical protein SF83666_c01160 [Sinorhizobium fredii CCBAU 83666]AWI55801.1 hypothetical protein AB395_0000115 [Sinorhizobium fredii CCBAU 45436]AWM23401.1 hypothetical protein AOX55_0000116 [Sinorhizobium fredii CCBAU 25509]KSV92725.1 hypothetical protein N181_00490 [Sinorhizobium fredii USDA 205]